MHYKINKNIGFTIVELLIVIVVVGILAALVLNSFSQAQVKARDSKRVTDVKALEKYAKLYIAENGVAPQSTAGCYAARSYLNAGECEDFINFQDITKYMGNSGIPKDPINSNPYFYYYYKSKKVNSTGNGVENGTLADFVIVARLESSPNPTFTFNGHDFNHVVGTR
jgi:prepilin-type N-terminal cleavage/methylation domain-containing protein